MSSLSSDLLALLETNNLDSQSRSDYRERIFNNADTLNTLSEKASSGSLGQRAALVGKVSQIILGAGAVMPQDSTYTTGLQENWFDPLDSILETMTNWHAVGRRPAGFRQPASSNLRIQLRSGLL
jgi:hypothetical protein